MYGKVLGAGIGGCLSMLLGWDPLVVFACVVTGAGLGHVFFDREAPVPKSDTPKSVEELVSEGQRRRAAEKARAKPIPIKPATAEQLAVVNSLCPIFVELGRSDGDVNGDEVRSVREFFQKTLSFDEPGLEAVRVALKSAIAAPVQELEPLVKSNRSAVKPSLRVDVLRAMYEMCLADGDLKRSEHDGLKRVVQHFNLSDEQLLAVTKEFFGSGKKHYDTLGLEETASDDEIRSAFRKLAAENHPDRVAALGPKEAEAAAARFREVKDAYEALKQLRGL